MKIISRIFTGKLRLFCILTAFLLSTHGTWAAPWTGNSTPITPVGNTYYVDSPEKLAWVASQTNTFVLLFGYNTFAGKTIVLTADLDMNGSAHNWTPIGSGATTWVVFTYTSVFQGIFDGNGHTISNLKVSQSSDYAGFFGYVQNDQSTAIKNLTLSNVNISGDQYLGGLAGYVYQRSSITGCTVSGSVTSTTTNNSAYAGGLVGYFDPTNNGSGANITSCSSSVNVQSTNNKDYVGGLLGYLPNQTLTISGCSASGTVTGGDYIGGLVGGIRDYNQVVTQSSASGNVTGNGSYSGGFIGSIINGSTTISNCYSTGNVSGADDYCGGFIGQVAGQGSISNCFATGNVVTSNDNYVGGFIGSWTGNGGTGVANSYATGSVTKSGQYVGGFIGNLNQWVSFNSCYATGIVQGSSYSGGFIGQCSAGTLSGCYASGSVKGSSSTIAGFAGNSSNYSSTGYFDAQGTGQTTGINGNGTATSLTTAALVNASTPPWGAASTWIFKQGYYPQLAIFSANSDANIKAWSALSVVPLNLTPATETTASVTLDFTAPKASAPTVGSALTWASNYQPSDAGLLNFTNDAAGDITLLSSGTATFTTTDGTRTKTYFVTINFPFARYYVNNNGGSDGNTGSSWSAPFKNLQTALGKCTTPSKNYQIWVAKGSANYSAASSSFILKKKVSIYGGFAGSQATEYPATEAATTGILNARNIKTNSTTLTGTGSSIVSFTAGDGDWSEALLDGFTVTGAVSGSFAVNTPTGATIQNCKIAGNAGEGLNLATGAYAYNVLVADNGTSTSDDGVTMAGTATLVNATIVNNKGLGINTSSSSATVKNTILWGNNGNTSSTTAPTMTYCAASSNYGATAWPSGGTGNVELYHRSPNFKDAVNATIASRNYELLLISPCLGKGDASANLLATDASGLARIYNTNTIDLGAFQKWDGYYANGNNISQYRNASPISIPTFASSIAKSSNQANVELQVPAGITFDMATNIIYTNYLEIMDDNTTAPIIKNGTLYGSKALYVRKCTRFRTNGTTGASTFFSLPFATSAFSNTWPANTNMDGAIIENSVRLLKYDENKRALSGTNQSAWTATTSALEVGKGYAITFASKVLNNDMGTTIIFPSSGSVTFGTTTSATSPLSCTTTTGVLSVNSGWNLIGNPLAQMANVVNNNTTYWPYNLGVASYAGGIYLYTPTNDSYTVTPIITLNTAGLSPYGAYFVKTDYKTSMSAQLSGVTSGTGPMRVQSAVSASTTDVATPSVLHLQIDNGTVNASTYVIFADDAHAEMVDVEDSPNMTSVSNGTNIVMNTFATGSSVGLGINSLPFTGSTVEIPVQVSVPQAGDYSISLPEGYSTATVYLKDASGNLTDITNGSISVSIADASVASNYTLILSRVATSDIQSKTDGLTFIQDQTHVTVSSPDALQRINVYGVNGQLFRQLDVNGTEAKFDLPSTDGVYIVKVSTTKGLFTKKLVSR